MEGLNKPLLPAREFFITEPSNKMAIRMLKSYLSDEISLSEEENHTLREIITTTPLVSVPENRGSGPQESEISLHFGNQKTPKLGPRYQPLLPVSEFEEETKKFEISSKNHHELFVKLIFEYQETGNMIFLDKIKFLLEL